MEMITAERTGTRHHTPNTELVMRAMREFDELPALHLTLDQAARLLSIDRDTCKDVLDELVGAQILEQDRTGRYARHHR